MAFRIGSLFLAGSLLMLAPRPALAAAAETALKTKHGEIATLVRGEQKEKLNKAFDGVLDYDTLARASLGELWEQRSATERAEFQKLLTELVRAAYQKSIKRTLDYSIEYRGETKLEPGVLVRTVAQNKKNVREEAISIDYAMHSVGGRWMVRDIVTDGASLVNNYKNQFRRIMKQHGFPELLRRMRTKIEKGDPD